MAIVPLASADELKIKGYIKSDPIRGGNNYLREMEYINSTKNAIGF